MAAGGANGVRNGNRHEVGHRADFDQNLGPWDSVIQSVRDQRMHQRLETSADTATGGAPCALRRQDVDIDVKVSKRLHEIPYNFERPVGFVLLGLRRQAELEHLVGRPQHPFGGADDHLAAESESDILAIIGRRTGGRGHQAEGRAQFVEHHGHGVERRLVHYWSTVPLHLGHHIL